MTENAVRANLESGEKAYCFCSRPVKMTGRTWLANITTPTDLAVWRGVGYSQAVSSGAGNTPTSAI